MQGRLLSPVDGQIQAFPRGRWEEEFPLLREVGYACIELTIDAPSLPQHPANSSAGRSRLRALSLEFGIALTGLCCDVFMDQPLVSEDGSSTTEAEALLTQLIQNSGDLELGFVELPFMKKNAVLSPKTRTQLIAVLERALPVAERAGVDILLETDLAPEALVDLLGSCRHPRLGVNYDTGNSTWFGFDPAEELGTYHADIRHIHIKDCTRSSYSVPLGSGETKFDIIFGLLAEFGYRHDFVVQGARQPDDLAAARDYLNVTRRLIDRFLKPLRS